MLNNFWPCIGPKAKKKEKKRYHRIWEANLQPLGPMLWHLLISWCQCRTFISNLGGPNHKPKMLKVGPKFFQPCVLLVESGPISCLVKIFNYVFLGEHS
jgi:hypothetical protein